jgi:hypothetical protein
VLKQENDDYVILGTHTGITKKAKSGAWDAIWGIAWFFSGTSG